MPSHLSSNAHPGPRGDGPALASIGATRSSPRCGKGCADGRADTRPVYQRAPAAPARHGVAWRGVAWRFELDPSTRKATNTMLSGVAGEFPKINDSWLGRENRWGYFATTRELSPVTMTDGLARFDHVTGQTAVLEGPDGLTNPREPVFVQRRGSVEENDGYLLSLWWNPASGLSELLVHHAVRPRCGREARHHRTRPGGDVRPARRNQRSRREPGRRRTARRQTPGRATSPRQS